jgi:hypothetical protein
MENAIVDEFTTMIDQCQGKVFFLTGEGDRLVADSMLSALVGIAMVLSHGDSAPQHIQCDQSLDCERITGFIRKHHLGHVRSSRAS